jgi:hypothetical protein
MTKRRPPAPFPVCPNATTVGPQVVRAFTKDSGLEERTLAGIFDEGGHRLRIFRQSSMDHDNLSCEIYRWVESGWALQRKERVKYVPPEELRGNRSEIGGIPVWSFEQIDASQADIVRALLRPKR